MEKTIEELIHENKNLIYSITRYFEKYPNKEDLFQVGCIGIIKAYKNYDSKMNVKFTTYAYTYILGEMMKLVREDKSVKISRNIQVLNLKIEKAKILLTQKLMRTPTSLDLSQFLEIPVDIIEESMNCSKTIYSIDEPLNDEGKEVTLQDTIGEMDNIDDYLILKEAISQLTPYEQSLINKRYMCDLTQQQTAKELGTTQVQVYREEQKILTKLRSKLVE